MLQSQHNLRSLLEAIDDPLFVHDGGGKLLDCNQAACQWLGYRREELLAKTLSELETADARDGENRSVPTEFISGLVPASEGRFVHRNGRELSASIRRTVIEYGDHEAVLTAARDLSNHKNAEEALCRSEDLLRKVVESTPIGIWMGDRDFRVQLWNAGLEAMTGVPRQAVLGKNVFELFPSLIRSGLADMYRKVVETGQPLALQNIRFDDPTLAREHYWLNLHAQPLRDASGQVSGIVLTVEDISEQKQNEEALRESEERHRVISELISDYVYAGRVYPDALPEMEWITGPIERISGYTVEEIKAAPDGWFSIACPEFRDMFMQSVPKLLAGEPVVHEYYIRTKSGETRWLRDYAQPVWDEETGRVTRILGGVQDISERKRTDADKETLSSQLRRAQKMEAIGQLAGGVAHDFNNILTAVLGNVELLRSHLEADLGSDEVRSSYLDQIERAAQRAAALTRQMLAFSRRQNVRREVLDLNQVVRDVEQMLRRLIPENIALEFGLAPDLSLIRADAGQLEQVIVNLAVNARDAMPDGGELYVETANVLLDDGYVATHPEAQVGPHVLLTVQDAGCGMSADVVERIFEPFFTTKTGARGTGLGLATVYGIVRQCGGHIMVDSRVDEGSTFRVYLPAVHATPAAQPAEKVGNHTLTGTEHVLLCEDDEHVRELTARFLQAAGYTVLIAQNAEHALSLASQHSKPIDLLVTDIVMPDMSGRALAARLTTTTPDLRTLYISGHDPNVIRDQGVGGGSTDILEKPFTRRALLQRVRAALA